MSSSRELGNLLVSQDLIELLVFYCSTLDISHFYNLLASFKEKIDSLHRTINTIYKDQILFNNSSDSSQKCSLKFFFFPLFLKHLISFKDF